MSKVEKATAWMEQLARDDSHGYDQIYRWGERGDYDCSAAIITAYEQAGIPVKTNGATYTGNMKRVFLATGFKDVTASVNLATGAGLERGDVLLNQGQHTALYLGGGYLAEASINEFGGIEGGKPGDQTGKEVAVNVYRNANWDVILRYPENYYSFKPKTLKLWDEGVDVFRIKVILKARNFYSASINYKYGNKGVRACKRFQKAAGLPVTGICDAATWRTLYGLEIRNGYYIVQESVKGDTGTSVLLLQEMLKGLGYDTGKLDRVFGPKTEAALKQFQQKAKLKVTGRWTTDVIRYMIG